MPARQKSRGWGLLTAGTVVAVTAALTPAGGATAAGERTARADGAGTLFSEDTRELSPGERGKFEAIDRAASRPALREARREGAFGRVAVGDQQTWLAADFVDGTYLKSYELRGVGRNVQVWVANNRSFPEGDCRDALGLTDITQTQVDRFVEEFSGTIYPLESKVFSTPPDRNGSGGAAVAAQLGLPEDYWQVGRKRADDIVVLIDNVRDENYYEPGTEAGQTFVAGFFSSTFNELLDRNIMTVDVFDWLHRTGDNPPDDTFDPEYQACTEELTGSTPLGTPRPNDYEGVFAHEYQHLLEYYEDVDELNWVNEGLADWAQTLTGYVNPRLRPSNPGADSHFACFGGYLPESFGGPENSLTQWEDQGGAEVLCDYGAAYTFMEYLHSRYGDRFMGRLHRTDANGLVGLSRVLEREGVRVSAQRLVRRWAAMVAVDLRIDRRGVVGARPGALTARSLRSVINWETEEAYASPGAPANGSDYVRLRNGAGDYLSAADVGSLTFTGGETFAPEELAWTEVATPPDSVPAGDDSCGTTTPGAGPAALYSGCGPDLDRSVAYSTPIAVPAGSPTLTFDALWDIEAEWDFAFVQVSADGGETWESVATEGTTTTHNPSVDPATVALLPGFSGSSDGWQAQTADLSAYAGQDVLLSFRYVTDPEVNEAGFWVRDIDVAGTPVPTDLAGWDTQTGVNPLDVDGWTVQLVAYGPGQPVRYAKLRVDPATFTGTLDGAALREAIGDEATTVAAIVMQDDPDEDAPGSASYVLEVDGVVQPGGDFPAP